MTTRPAHSFSHLWALPLARIEMTKYDERYDRYLGILAASKKPLTLKEWAAKIDKPVPTIWRYSKLMLDAGHIRKLSPGKFRGGDRFRAVAAKSADIEVIESVETLTSSELLSLLLMFSKKPWEPKAFRSARSLPVGLSKLYGLAVEAAYGGRVEQEDLDTIRKELNEFLTDIKSLAKVVGGTLHTPELWSEATFVEHLLKGKDPEQIKEFAHRARELN